MREHESWLDDCYIDAADAAAAHRVISSTVLDPGQRDEILLMLGLVHT